jgi:hypothetical protein
MQCSTDADCLPLTYVAGNVSTPDWCVTSAECNTAKGACVVWPRCRNTPYFGCIAAAQLCESTRLEGQPPPYSGTNLTLATGIPWLAAAPSFLLPLVFLLLGAVATVVLFAAWRVRRDCCAGGLPRPHPEARERLLHPTDMEEHYTRATNLF